MPYNIIMSTEWVPVTLWDVPAYASTILLTIFLVAFMVLMPDILSDTWKIIIPTIPGVLAILFVACNGMFNSVSLRDGPHVSIADLRERLNTATEIGNSRWLDVPHTRRIWEDREAALNKRIREEQDKVKRLEAKLIYSKRAALGWWKNCEAPDPADPARPMTILTPIAF
jgi:hypothetical protein